MLSHPKITPAHLAKQALVSVRQSTPKQVLHHQESQRLQYALVERARALGGHQSEVIDDDLGHSASAGTPRVGFKKLLATVVLGEVGIVLSTEVSRLSRPEKDWCHVLEICKVCAPFIGDAEHVYDVTRTDAQVLLGMTGTLSVREARGLQSRLFQGQEPKAKRGALYTLVAPGSVCVDGKSLVTDPHVRVQEAIALVFAKCRALWSVRQVWKWFHDEGSELPVNKSIHGKVQLAWPLPTSHAVKYILQNPGYAGAYVYGQRHTTLALGEDKSVRTKRVQQRYDHARVFLPAHHEPYSSWELFVHHHRMLAANAPRLAPQDEAATSVRQGHGLLSGLLRWGHCGRKLHGRYGGKSGTAARYVCRGDVSAGGQYWLGFGGASIEKQSSEQVLETISPLTLEASVHAAQSYEAAQHETPHALRWQMQQVEYEAARAFAQYDQADPQPRLVTSQLESRWNAK
jgi:DNA invertase Pin-like site-specific DNA recombinase